MYYNRGQSGGRVVQRVLLGAIVLVSLAAVPAGYPQEEGAAVLPGVVVQAFEGQVTEVDRQLGTIVVRGADKEVKFDVPRQAKIFKDDEISGFAEILTGDLAIIKYYIDSFGVATVLSVTLESYGSDFSHATNKGSQE